MERLQCTANPNKEGNRLASFQIHCRALICIAVKLVKMPALLSAITEDPICTISAIETTGGLIKLQSEAQARSTHAEMAGSYIE